MKQYALVITLICCVSVSSIPYLKAQTGTRKDTTVSRVKYNYVSRHANGQLHELGNYIYKPHKNIKHGPWIVTDDDCKFIERGSYNKDKKEGRWSERTDEGFCCWSGDYKNNKRSGRWGDGANRYCWYKRGKQVRGIKD